MLSCTEISFVISFFFSILRNLESNPGFLLRNSINLLIQNLEEKKSNFDMFHKIIAEQSSIIQHAWPMCHMKEE